jgi:hypothetical protein
VGAGAADGGAALDGVAAGGAGTGAGVELGVGVLADGAGAAAEPEPECAGSTGNPAVGGDCAAAASESDNTKANASRLTNDGVMDAKWRLRNVSAASESFRLGWIDARLDATIDEIGSER